MYFDVLVSGFSLFPSQLKSGSKVRHGAHYLESSSIASDHNFLIQAKHDRNCVFEKCSQRLFRQTS